jgi:hypothetical protein
VKEEMRRVPFLARQIDDALGRELMLWVVAGVHPSFGALN